MKMRVIMCPAERKPYVTWIEDSLENLQRAVGGYIDILMYDEIGWRDGCCYVSGVSHWMPLPGMPEGEGDECKNRKSRGTSA